MATEEREANCLSDSALRELLLEYRRENWKGIQSPDTQASVVDQLLHGDAEGPLRQLEAYVPLTAETRILDLGSGVGTFVVACRRRGLQAFGLEPDRIGQGAQITAIQIARKRLALSVFVNGIGEALPFADSSFDVVVMNQVIEHVDSQSAVIREAARVTREGGAIYLACPNYLRFYEPHYKILWFPLLPRFIGRAYLRLRGRSSAMLNQITYTTNRRLRKLLAVLGPEFIVFDLHREQFMKKRADGSFAASSTRLISKATHLPLIGGLLLTAVLRYASLAEGGCEIIVLRRVKQVR